MVFLSLAVFSSDGQKINHVGLETAFKGLCNRSDVANTAHALNLTCSTFIKELVPTRAGQPATAQADLLQPIRHTLQRAQRRGLLHLGVLGGSVSCGNGPAQHQGFATYLQSFLEGALGDGVHVQVVNGAIGASGSTVPAGCLGRLLGARMDIVVLEFALNDRDINSLARLVHTLRRAYGSGVAILVLEITSRRVEEEFEKLKKVFSWGEGVQVANNEGLPHVNWRANVKRVYGEGMAPEVIWSNPLDSQHPNQIGQVWIALTVTHSILDAAWSHQLNETFTATLPGNLHHYNARDEVCASRFCMADCKPVLPLAMQQAHTALHYQRVGACWAEENVAKAHQCDKFVVMHNSSLPCKPELGALEYAISIGHNCRLFLGFVQLLSYCDVNVDVDGHVYALRGVYGYGAQVPRYITDLPAGNHSILVLPEQRRRTDNVCRIASLFCVQSDSRQLK